MEKTITYIKITGAGICAVVAQFLGGWDKALQILLVSTAIDILTGLLMAIYTKELNSGKAYKGGIRKIGMYLMVGLACFLDQFFKTNFIRTAMISYYIATEGISILENWGKMELPLPSFIKGILKQLQERADGGEVK